jgi:predicted DsbA family dithiol-disulfide isomerase
MPRAGVGHKPTSRRVAGTTAVTEIGARVANRLTVYTDYVAPACYLAEPVLDRLRHEHGIEIAYRPFELFPAPLAPPDFSAVHEIAAWAEVIEPLARRLGVRLTRPRRGVRTRKAHEAVWFARAHDAGDALHRALFAAYFGDGLDIGRVDVLVRLGEDVGLDRTALRVALDLDTHADAVAAAREKALRAGITGAPAFVAARRTLVGWHDAETLLGWLRGGGGPPRPET